MQASSRALSALVFALAAWAIVPACSLVVDFDRSKIHAGGSGGAGAHPSNHTGGTTTASGGSIDVDSGMGGGSGAGGDGGGMGGAGGSTGGAGGTGGTPAACDLATHEGCDADELCCSTPKGPACRKTSVDECQSCGTPCSTTLAKSCSGRTCECDPASNRPCSGKGAESFCLSSSSSARCVECRDFTDCAGRSDGKTECVGNKCVTCDPSKTNAGCSGQTPVCDPTTLGCKACSTSSQCGGSLVCTGSGSCGGCRTSATDCVAPTTPICDAGTTECRGCSSNQECQTELNLAYCVDDSRCSPCQPTTEQGCTDPAKPDCRAAANGNLACQACVTDDHCKNLTATPVCDAGTGKCVECTADNDCSGNAKKPLCVGNVCVACDTSTVLSTADQRCAAKQGGAGACIQTGTEEGQCGACDPADSAGCAADELCCERGGVPTCVGTSASECTGCGVACNPTLANTCTGRGCRCGSSAPCSGTGTARFCTGSPGSCVECLADGDCTDPTAPLCESNQCVACDGAANANMRCQAKQAGACASGGSRKGRCADCDPKDDTGCSGSNQCDPATATCVGCVDDSGCSGKNDKCDTSTQTCVDCTAAGGCADTPATPICNVAAEQCDKCTVDAECQAGAGTAGPLCSLAGTCNPDDPCTGNGDCTDGIHSLCLDVSADMSGENRCRECDPSNYNGCTSGTCGADYICR
jgi:hypothetical protein